MGPAWRNYLPTLEKMELGVYLSTGWQELMLWGCLGADADGADHLPELDASRERGADERPHESHNNKNRPPRWGRASCHSLAGGCLWYLSIVLQRNRINLPVCSAKTFRRANFTAFANSAAGSGAKSQLSMIS